MKKIMVFISAAVCVLALAGCTPTAQNDVEETTPVFEVYCALPEEAAKFSYEEDTEVYLSDDVKFAGETEIRQGGFFNITTRTVENTLEAYERATSERSISYDRASVFYDSSADMWKVYFFTSETNGQSGDRQLIYLGSDGITRLIVTCK